MDVGSKHKDKGSSPSVPVQQVGKRKRIGFWLTEKKARQMNIEEDFGKVCWDHGMELVKIRLDENLESQGPFCSIIHKVSDLMVLAEQGVSEAKEACQRFEEFTRNHPEMVIIDPLENVSQLSNRHRIFKTIESINRDRSTVFTPTFVELTTMNSEENLSKLKLHNVNFPLVCKPLPSHGSTLAHEMCIIFGPQGLKDIEVPCVAQSFVCHGAILHKIFVIGQSSYVFERPSLKNFKAGDNETIFFNSHDVSKSRDPNSWLIKLDAADAAIQPLLPNRSQLDDIARLLRKKFGLDLFGVDVIVEAGTGKCAVIDVNTFPGYTEVPGLWDAMFRLVLSRMAPHQVPQLNGSALCNTRHPPKYPESMQIALKPCLCSQNKHRTCSIGEAQQNMVANAERLPESDNIHQQLQRVFGH